MAKVAYIKCSSLFRHVRVCFTFDLLNDARYSKYTRIVLSFGADCVIVPIGGNSGKSCDSMEREKIALS